MKLLFKILFFGFALLTTVKEAKSYVVFDVYNANLMLSANRWQFNGKEKQTTGNINYMDYGARMYDDFTGRWFVIDPLAEKYYFSSVYAYCVNNPLRFVDPNGMDWYSYEEKYTDENNEEQTRTRYKYVRGTMSEKEIEEGGYTHLGKTYTTGNNYYSLFGHKMDLRTQQGQVYQKIDEAVIAYGNWKEKINSNNDPFNPESPYLYGTNMSTQIKIQGSVEYEGSFSGFYEQFTGYSGHPESKTDAMTGKVVNLFDGMYIRFNGVLMKVPFQLHGGGFGNATKSSQWLLIWNGTTKATDIPNPIVGLQYTTEQANKMLEKFYKLFPSAK